MCRRWSTSLPEAVWPPKGRMREPAARSREAAGRGARCRLAGRVLLAVALLLAPLSGWWGVPAAAMPICAADGGVRHVPDPLAPAAPSHPLCDACLAVPPALPAVAPPIPLPRAAGLAWAAVAGYRVPPGHPPPEQARGPPPA